MTRLLVGLLSGDLLLTMPVRPDLPNVVDWDYVTEQAWDEWGKDFEEPFGAFERQEINPPPFVWWVTQ